MQHTYQRNSLLAFLLVCVSLLSGCSDKEEEETKPKDITVSAFADRTLADPTLSDLYINVNDLLIGDTKTTVWRYSPSESGEKIVLKDNNPYSFELSYRVGFITNPLTKTNYSGSIPKALFTNTDKSNKLKIAIVDRQPFLYMNDVKLADPIASTGGGTGNACYEGTWKTAGGCTSAPTKQLTYYFGPLSSSGSGQGYSQGPDCSGLCSSTPKFNFTYTVTGNKINYSFTSVSQPVCSVAVPPVQTPQGNFTITYTCGNNNNELVTEAVNVQTGVRTVLTFTRG